MFWARKKSLMRYGAWVFCALVLSSAGATPPWFVRTWQSDEGLPDNSVKGIAQSPDGFIWVATETGLVRFDGLQFREFPLLTPGLETRTIQALCVDRRGRVWVAREPGIVLCLDQGQTKVMLAPKNPPALRRARLMVEDGEGAVWVSHTDGTLVRIKDGKPRFYTSEDGLPVVGAGMLAVDQGGQLWFQRSGRVGVFREGRFLTLGEAPFEFICAAHGGGVWLCSRTALARYTEDEGLVEHVKLDKDIVRAEVTAFLEDRSGRFWIGTRFAGLFCMDGTDIQKVEMSLQPILCLKEDCEGTIWVGTRGGGLKQVKPRVVELMTTSERVPFAGIQSLCKDTKGQLWAITWEQGTVLRNVDNTWIPLSSHEGWTIPLAKCVAAEPRGGVWIGTQQHGIFLLQDGAVTRHFSTTNGLAGNYVNALRATPSGTVWIGVDTEGRRESFLQCWKEEKFHTFTLPSKCGTIMAIEVDTSGACWVATQRGKLVCVRGTRVTDETHTLLSEPLQIRTLLATPDNSLWIGFGGRGLGRLKDGQFTHCRRGQGIPDDFISQILCDGNGRLWLAGNRGIFSVREKDWDAFAEGRDAQLPSVVYRQNDGQPGLQASYDVWPGAFRDHEGRLYFALQSGLATLYPDAIKDDPLPPKVVIDRVLANGTVVALYGAIEEALPKAKTTSVFELGQAGADLLLPRGKRQVEIYFTAPMFMMPESIRFKYQLKGLDQEWIEAGTRRSALYSLLSPGRYRFQVIACNRDGVWNMQGATLTLTVPSFWWETAWFRVGGMLSAFGVVVGLVVVWLRRRQAFKLEKLQLQQVIAQERARIAADLHDDVGAGLTEIALLSDVVQLDMNDLSEDVNATMQRIFQSASEMAQALDEIVWAVNPGNDTLEKLITFAGEFAQTIVGPTGLRCRLDLPIRVPRVAIDSSIRHQVCMILKESLHNVIKHAHAREINLHIGVQGQVFEIAVSDDGVGFDPAALCKDPGTHNGLINMRQRMTAIGGTCEIHSVPGQGTRVLVQIRIEGLP